MLRAHRIALDPANRQATLLAQHAGFARVAYNHALADFKAGLDANEWRGDMTLRPRWNAVKREAYPWCAPLCQVVAKNAICNLGLAIGAWNGRNKDGSPRKTKNRFPRFKKRGKSDSFRIDNGRGTIATDGASVRLPKIGTLRMREAVRFDGEIVQCTVSKTAGRWFASFVVDTKAAVPQKRIGRTIGVDVGLKTLAVCSDGISYSNPRPLVAAQRKLRRMQRKLSRRVKGSNRRAAMKSMIARQHYRIACLRRDSHHKATTAIAKRGAHVVCETLNVKGMMKNRRLARAIADAGLAEFVSMLRYKCELHGAEFEQASPVVPVVQAVLAVRQEERRPDAGDAGVGVRRLRRDAGPRSERGRQSGTGRELRGLWAWTPCKTTGLRVGRCGG